MKRKNYNPYFWPYVVVILAVALVGIASTFFVYSQSKKVSNDSLLQRSGTLAKALDVSSILKLSGTASDISDSEYQSLKNKLREIHLVNVDTRFVYLVGYKNNSIFFFVDSEDPSSPAMSPPGQVYTEADPAFREVFTTKQPALTGIYTDRWGKWITALTPIINPQTNQVIAVACMDIDASKFINNLWVYSAVPGLSTLFILALLIIGLVIRLRQQRLLDVQSQLVSIASHEIRSPLNGISWASEIMLNNALGPLEEKQRASVKMIFDSSRRLLDTLNDLLDLPEIQGLVSKQIEFEPVMLLPLLKESVKNFELFAQEMAVNVVFDASLNSQVVILGDHDKLQRMFNNLISNAIKYSRPHTSVEIGCKSQGRKYIISIKDHGIGMSQQDQNKVFEAFYRAPNAKATTNFGTGLGLYYVKQVVELNRGKIWLESEINQGSTFFVQFLKA